MPACNSNVFALDRFIVPGQNILVGLFEGANQHFIAALLAPDLLG
jgi:hypothetical protein